MSGTNSVGRRLMLVASIFALAGAASLAESQVPTKPPPKDTAKVVKQQAKPAVKTDVAKPAAKSEIAKPAAKKHIKIAEEPITATSGGEIAPVVKPCEPAPPIVVIDSSRDEEIRADQYKLDSISAVMERNRLNAEANARVERMRQQMLADQLAKEEAAKLALKRHLARGYYFGVAGGATAPQRAVRDGYTGGWNVTVPLGFDANDWPLGIRTDVSIDHLNGTTLKNQQLQLVMKSGDITVWSWNADLKLRVPAPGGSTRTNLYLLGGAGAHKVTGGVYGTTSADAGKDLTFANAGTKFGWNAGAGAAFSFGSTEMFVESRFFQVKTDLPYRLNGGIGNYTSFTPIVVGLSWF